MMNQEVLEPERFSISDPCLSKEQLEVQLADADLLHRLSIELIQEDGLAGLYKKIVQAAVTIMRSQFGTIQMLYPDGQTIGKLRLLAASGFSADAEKYWEWVYQHTYSSCGEVLRTGKRVIIPDYAKCEFMQGAETLPIFLEGGVYAAQSTPLYSRTGKLLGMISTHWRHVHNPPERHLRLLDILARQASDLIERVNASEALRQSETRMRALSTATNDVMYRMSPDWKEMYRLDGRDFLEDTDEPIRNWVDKYIHPEDKENVNLAIEKAIKSAGVFQSEHRVLKADGTVGWVSSKAIPIFDDEGKIVEWFGAATDVTEKKSFVSALESRVEERTTELQRSNENLQQFAHVASHDLKEPVRKIKTFALRLKEELNRQPSEQSHKFMDKILESANRMTTMIDGVLTYSTMNAAELKFEVVNLDDLIADIQNDLEVLIQQKQAVIQSDRLQSVEGVQVLLYQLFYNLIYNSLKFAKDTETPKITIASSLKSDNGVDQLVLVLTDNGIGFDDEYKERIFHTFTRLNPKTSYDGTGLGLSLCRKIVERHHGSIEAMGKTGVGATFRIILPVKQRAF
jgi:signal transduction histidine kinase